MKTLASSLLRISSSSVYHRLISQQCFLHPSYRCDEAWNQRLQHSPVQAIKQEEFYYDIDRKFRNTSKVFALDADLFVNKLKEEDMNNLLEEVEEVTHRLRKSPDTSRALPSTAYAVMRLFLDINHRDMILKIISAPEKYGVFPETHMWNLMFDHFLANQDYTACARIASSMMLQEDFCSSLTLNFALLSCLQWDNTEQKGEWKDYHPLPPEPEDEVKVRVSYISRPYNDEHFDLKDPNHIVGRTLLLGSQECAGVLSNSCKVLGLALCEKWSDLIKSFEKLLSSSTYFIPALTVDRIASILEGIECAEKERITSCISKLRTSNKTIDIDLINHLEEQIKKMISDQQSNDIESQALTFKSWLKLREKEIDFSLREYEKKKLLEEIAKKRELLEEKEERIFFFENQDKLKLMIADKKKFMEDEENTPQHPMFQWKKKKVRKDLGEEYIPPEVTKRRT